MDYIKKPYEYLKEYCLSKNLAANSKDIKILDVMTSINMLDSSVKEFDFKSLQILDDDETYLNCDQIEQRFLVEIIPASASLCEFKLAADKQLLKCVAVFYLEQCDLNHDDEVLIQQINQDILKKLLKAGLLLGVRKSYDDKSIKEVLDKLRNSEPKVLLELAKGVAAFEGLPARMIEHYKLRSKHMDKERGFMMGVKADELVLEYVFATASKDGKNLAGQLIKPELIRANNSVPFRVADNIKEQIGPTSAKFYAKEPGFIEYSRRDNLYSIKDKMQIQTASFKSTGSIDGGGIDTNVTLDINESDVLEDAVGPSVTLDVAKLNVKGSVAQNAIIKAGIVNIGGQTHSKSQIYAKQAHIAFHRGFVRADSVEVNTLEGGVIEAQDAQVNKALGGKIVAKQLIIQEALGNTTCEIGKSVKIIKNIGENNRFIISAAKDLNLRARVKKIEDDNKARAALLIDLNAQIQSKRQYIENNKDNVSAIWQKLREFKAKNIAIPTAFSLKIKEFKSTMDELNDLNLRLSDLKLDQEAADLELKDLQDSIFNTYVECLSPWSNACEVRFELISPPKTFSYISNEGDRYNFIRLAKSEDGEIYIKKERHDSVY